MKKSATFHRTKIYALILTLTLSMGAITLSGCTENDGKGDSKNSSKTSDATTAITTTTDTTITTTTDTAATNVGEGETAFVFEVVDKDENITRFNISTNETKVGIALENLGLIEGEKSSLGLYVEKVNGISASYENDKTWWAFNIDGVLAQNSIDSTDIKKGEVYSFVFTQD